MSSDGNGREKEEPDLPDPGKATTRIEDGGHTSYERWDEVHERGGDYGDEADESEEEDEADSGS